MATATKAHLVHLPEYAMACGIPTMAVSSKDIGPAALAGDWPTVHKQVLSHIFTTSILAARDLARRAYGNWSKASLKTWASLTQRYAIEPQ